jgi:hypothetical protein
MITGIMLSQFSLYTTTTNSISLPLKCVCVIAVTVVDRASSKFAFVAFGDATKNLKKENEQ